MLIDHIDAENRLIHLSVETMNIAWHPVELYQEVRALRVSDETLRGYDNFMEGAGNINKGGGKATERYFTLMFGTRIVPYDESHVIDITGTLITDDGYEGAFCFDKSHLSAGVSVDIQYAPKQVEVINLNFDDLVYSSFQGGVWVDPINGYEDVGTDNLPNGNTERPVKYVELAVEIAKDRGFRTIHVLEDIELGEGVDIKGMKLIGVSHSNTDLTVLPECECHLTIFESFNIEGTLDGGSEISRCVIGDLDFFEGHIHDSVLRGVVKLSSTLTGHAILDNCNALDIGSPPTLDVNGSLMNVTMPHWSGPLIISNVTEDIKVGLGVDAGKIVLLPSCVNGHIAASGAGNMDNMSAHGCLVSNGLTDGIDINNIKRLIEYLRPHHTGTGNMWFWDPINGDDEWDGMAEERAFKTFAKTHEAVVDNNHDIIAIVPGDPSGVTIINEKVTFTKNYVFMRGPGRDVIFRYTNETVGFDIQSNGVELSGFRVENTTDDSTAIHSTGKFTMVNNVWLEKCDRGMLFEDHHPIISNMKIHTPKSYAMRFQGDISHGEITNITCGGARQNAVEIDTTAASGGIKMRDSVLTMSQGSAVWLGPTTKRFMAFSSNIITNNVVDWTDESGGDDNKNYSMGSTVETGLDEDSLHSALDSYENKEDYKADVSNLEVGLSGVPADVWSYVTRELTVAAGLTPEQEAKLDEIITDISEVPTAVENADATWGKII